MYNSTKTYPIIFKLEMSTMHASIRIKCIYRMVIIEIDILTKQKSIIFGLLEVGSWPWKMSAPWGIGPSSIDRPNSSVSHRWRHTRTTRPGRLSHTRVAPLWAADVLYSTGSGALWRVSQARCGIKQIPLKTKNRIPQDCARPSSDLWLLSSSAVILVYVNCSEFNNVSAIWMYRIGLYTFIIITNYT